jgi:lysophospholipase L1-like esterase
MWRSLIAVIVPIVVPAIAAAATASTDASRFLGLGDSYTIGEGVAANERWPTQLAALLHAHGVAIDAPEIVARTGWTTDELAAAMDAHTFHPPYTLVTLLIGVNNQYRGRAVENYRSEFHALLERAIALAGNRPQRVIVVSIPDWGVTRFGHASGRDVAQIALEIDTYNLAAAEIAKALRVHFIDVTAASRDGGERADMLVVDGLHPSAAMYRRWAELVLPQAQAALTTR